MSNTQIKPGKKAGKPASASKSGAAKSKAAASSKSSGSKTVKPATSRSAKGTASGSKTRAKKKRNGRTPILILGAVCLLLFAIYGGGAWYYTSHFLPGTTISQMDLSSVKLDEIPAMLEEYELKVIERDAKGNEIESTITGRAIGLHMTREEDLAAILEKQPTASWIWAKGKVYDLGEFLSYDEESLQDVVNGLPGLNAATSEWPQDAYIEKRQDGSGYEIIPEQAGNRLKEGDALAVIGDAVRKMEESVNLIEADCYEKATVLSDDEYLLGQLQLLNHLSELEIVYEFGSQKEVLSGSQIAEWVTIEENEAILDKEKVADYVASLRKKYDTIFRSRTFDTSYGKTITISTGDYGWWMNYKQETEELYEMIMNGESGTRTPVYYQTAASYDTPDYGNTYIELNLTAQHMFYYEDGKLVLESDFVSGNPSRGNATPDGVYGITYKQRDATLTGETYATPVSYWMPFNKNVGLHDASWQSSFGGNRYLTHGSHGCINLPVSVARELYGYITKGTPVVCYELPGTEAVKAEDGGNGQSVLAASQNTENSREIAVGQNAVSEGTISIE